MTSEILHIHAQPFNHAEAYIVGTPASLAALRDTITAALLRQEPESCGSYAADGEGYTTVVIPLSSKTLPEELLLPYQELSPSEPPKSGKHPYDLVSSEMYALLVRRPSFSAEPKP